MNQQISGETGRECIAKEDLNFEGLFSDQRTLQESSLAKISRAKVKLELDNPPTRAEVMKATMQLQVSTSVT